MDPSEVGFMCPECEEGLYPMGGKGKGYWRCTNRKCGNDSLYVENEA